MFCPKCGKELPDNTKFCSACGARLEPVAAAPAEPVAAAPVEPVAAAPVEPVAAAPVEPVAAAPVEPAAAAPVAPVAASPVEAVPSPEQAKPPKGPIIGAVVAVAAVATVAVVCAVALLGNRVPKRAIFYQKENGKYGVVTNLNKEDSGLIFDKCKDIPEKNVSFALTKDKKGVYYYSKYDSANGSGTLSLAPYTAFGKNEDKNKAKTRVVAKDVTKFMVTDNDRLVYWDDKDKLKLADKDENKLIDKNVGECIDLGNDYLAYAVFDEDKNSELYRVNLKKPDDKELLCKDYRSFYETENKGILYTQKDDDELKLYAVKAGDKPVEIAKEIVSVIDYTEMQRLYFTTNVEKKPAYDYVKDSYTDEELNIAEPSYDDFQKVSYYYSSIYSPEDVLDENELYVSFDRDLAWFSYTYGGWFSEYSFKDVAEGDTPVPYEIATAAENFVKKYEKEPVNEDGYIKVTAAMKADLKAMAVMHDYGIEEDWSMLACNREENGYTTDYDAYNDAYDKYRKAEDIKDLRKELKKEDELSVCDLACYDVDTGKVTTLDSSVISYDTIQGGVSYKKLSDNIEQVDIEDVTYSFEVIDLIEEACSETVYITEYKNNNTYTFKQEDDEYAVNHNMYFVGDGIYTYNDDKELVYFAVNGNSFSSPVTVCDEPCRILGDKDDIIYYGTKGNGDNYDEAYSCKAGKSTKLTEDVMYLLKYSDGTIVGVDDDKDYFLLDGKGNSKEMEDVDGKLCWFGNNCYAYLHNDDLYYYNGKEAKKLASDVVKISCVGDCDAYWLLYIGF